MGSTDERWKPKSVREQNSDKNGGRTAKTPGCQGENSDKNGGKSEASGDRADVYPRPEGAPTVEDLYGEVEEEGDDSEMMEKETDSGMRIWPGLMPAAEEMYEEHDGEVDREMIAERVRRQYERYKWFRARSDQPRAFTECARVLRDSPREPGAREQILVELSMLDRVEARVFLDTWQPPPGARVLEEFRKVCVVMASENSG